MQVTWSEERQRFEAVTTFAEKDIPKAAGFRFEYIGGSKQSPCWYTKKAEQAAELAQYCDEIAKVKVEPFLAGLAQKHAKEQQSIELSRATSANLDIPCPEGLAFLPYQKGGIAFASTRPNTLIADEMGLGKTIQAIGIANADSTVRNVLIVCPASLRLNWKREWKKWDIKKLRVEIANGLWPNEIVADVRIVNYDILKKYAQRIRETDWDLLIVDEAHYCKNLKAQRTQLVLGYKNKKAPEKDIAAIQAKRRVFLTGTPIVNRPIELWPLVQSLDPSGLGRNFWYYAKRYADAHSNGYGTDFSGATNLDELQTKLRASVMVRRLKKDVLTELPPKRRQVIAIPGAESAVREESEAYERMESAMLEQRIAVELAKAEDSEEVYEQQVAKLRDMQRAVFTEMSAIRRAVAQAKLPFLIEHLEEAIESEGKVVCMVHHHEIVDALQEHFGISAVHLDGRDSMEDRQAAVDRFQKDDSCKLFVGSIHAAGVGITLTAASTVIFGELDWVPGNITQAEDRCHRIGQTDSVLVQHLVLDGSVDARMAHTLVAKQAVIDKALDSPVSQADMQAILMPAKIEASTKELSRRVVKEEAVKLSAETVEAIHTCLRMLARVCDYALSDDGQGFNGLDARIGHSLAESARLSAKQAVLGQKIIRKYKRQLPAELLATAQEKILTESGQ